MRQNLEVTLALMEGPIAVITLSGAVDSVSSELLDKNLDEALDSGHDHIVVDMKGLDFMSTAGWSSLVGKLRRLRTRKGAIHLCGLSPEVEEVYRLLEFDHLMPSHPTLEQALYAIRAGAAQ